MPGLRDILSRLLAIPGVRAVVLVGRDGLSIEATGRGDERFHEALGALGASVLGASEALGQELGQSRSVGVVLEYEDALVSVDPLGDFAAVVTLAESAASLGRIRTLLESSRNDILQTLDMR